MYTAHVFLFCFYFMNASSQRFDRCKVWDNTDLKCKECHPGYLGQNCSEICRYPTYGEECQKLCECEEEKYCDIATGCFSPDVGCRIGYFGSRCVNKCRFPTFGKGCQKTCQCSKLFCNYITGCDVSTGIIVYVIWRIKGPYLSNWRSFRDVTPIREHYTPQKATSQQHASLDMSQRTDDTYCSSYDARPFQYFNHAMNVSTDDISPQAHGKVPQRDGSAKTILFDISSSYGPDIHTIQKDKF